MTIEQLLTEAINNLNKIGYRDKTDWLKERQIALSSPDTRLKTLKELQPIWVGMGTFSDLSWPIELKSWSWEFSDTIYRAISDEIESINKAK